MSFYCNMISKKIMIISNFIRHKETRHLYFYIYIKVYIWGLELLLGKILKSRCREKVLKLIKAHLSR